MSKRRYRKVLRTLDETLIQPLKGSDDKKFNQMYENLWSQFGLTEKKRARMNARIEKKHRGLPHWERDSHKPCVNEWAWTEEAKDAFYGHEAHKKFVRKLKRMRGMTWGMWVLQCEPSDYTKQTKRGE